MIYETDMFIGVYNLYTALLKEASPSIIRGELDEATIDTLIELFEEDGWEYTESDTQIIFRRKSV